MPADTTTLALLREARERLDNLKALAEMGDDGAGSDLWAEIRLAGMCVADIDARLKASEGAGVEWTPLPRATDGGVYAVLPDGRQLVATPAGLPGHSPWAWSIYANSDPHSWIDRPGFYGEADTLAEAKAAALVAAGVR